MVHQQRVADTTARNLLVVASTNTAGVAGGPGREDRSSESGTVVELKLKLKPT